MKHNLKITILFLFILVFNCEKDDSVVKTNLAVSTPVIKTFSYETADAKFNQLKDQVKITKYLQVPEGSSLQGKSTKDTLGLTIATDIIKQVTFGDYTSYTMKIIYESDGTVFYNLTIEDKNGVPNVFITQYIPNDYWLNNKDEPFQGSIQSKNGDKLTVFNPDEGADEDNGGYEIDNNLGIGAGVGGTTGSYSANYPTDCFGTVIITTAWEAYQCTCNPGHWPGEYCTCHESGGELPGYNQVILYGCEENWDNDLDDPNDTTDPGGISETDPINDVSIGVLVKEDEECLPEDARPYDYDNSCSLDYYESCRMNGNSHEICVCTADGGSLEDCIISSCLSDYAELNLNTLALDVKTSIISFINTNGCNQEFIHSVLDDTVWDNLNLFEEENITSTEITDIVDYMSCFDLTQPAEVTIYVDQPKANSSDPYRVTWNPLDPIDVGHTFIKIKQGSITRTLGYYPIPNGVNMSSDPNERVIACQSRLLNDSSHEYDVSLTNINVTATQLTDIYNTAIDSEPTYDLNSYNCTDFGLEIINITGANVSDTDGTWPRGGNGSNPGNLGQDIRNMSLSSGITRDITGGTSTPNYGTCN